MIEELVSLFNQGELSAAIAAANAAVSKHPRDLNLRLVLIQLVCFTGNWERVEKIAKQLEALDPDREHVALTNFVDKLSIAEIQRKAVWNDGMVPEFVDTPDEVTKKLLWACSCRRAGNESEYAESLDFVLENTPLVTLHLNGEAFPGFRDLDDPCCTILEAFAIQGNYLWIPHHKIESLSVQKPTRLVDHLWSKARCKLTDGSDLSLFLPGIYAASFDAEATEALQLGRATEWRDVSGFETGFGRRVFGAGDREFTLFDFDEATFSIAADEA